MFALFRKQLVLTLAKFSTSNDMRNCWIGNVFTVKKTSCLQRLTWQIILEALIAAQLLHSIVPHFWLLYSIILHLVLRLFNTIHLYFSSARQHWPTRTKPRWQRQIQDSSENNLEKSDRVNGPWKDIFPCISLQSLIFMCIQCTSEALFMLCPLFPSWRMVV